MLKQSFFIGLILTFLIFTGSSSAQANDYLEEIKTNTDYMKLQEMRELEKLIYLRTNPVSGPPVKKTKDYDYYHTQIMILNFYTDYYKYIEPNETLLKKYNSKKIALCQKALKLQPESPKIISIMADGYLNMINGFFQGLKQKRMTNQLILMANSLDPSEPQLLYTIAKRELFINANINQAIMRLNELIQINPNNCFYLTFLGISYIKKNDLSKAKNTLMAALLLSPNNALARKELRNLQALILDKINGP